MYRRTISGAAFQAFLALVALTTGGLSTDLDETAMITGRITGYPSDWFPPMRVYARNLNTRSTFSIYSGGSLDFNAEINYAITVTEPGTYILFVWTDPEYSGVHIGGVYGEPDSSGTMVPFQFDVQLGQVQEGHDILANMFSIDQEQVPIP